jgi:hypothetical protein
MDRREELAFNADGQPERTPRRDEGVAPACRRVAEARSLLWAAGMATAVALALSTGTGCRSSRDAADEPEPDTAPARGVVLTPGDFRATTAPSSNPVDGAVPLGQPTNLGATPPTASAGTNSRGARADRAPAVVADPAGAVRDVTLIPGAPTQEPNPAARAANDGVLVDAMIGQINGKPVYAVELLSSFRQRLEREVETTRGDYRLWSTSADRLISGELRNRIENELLLAEARAQLTPEQRRGLLAFVQNIRENIASRFGGSEVLADQALGENDSEIVGTLAKKVADERDTALLRQLIQAKVLPRVIVFWRDAKNTYDRESEKFRPSPLLTRRLIEVPASDEARAQRVKDELAKGTPFEEVASGELNDFRRGSGGMVAGEIVADKPINELEISPIKPINDLARSLQPGQHGGPVASRTSLYWVKLEPLKERPSISLEDAQLEILTQLRLQKFQNEYGRFLEEIVDRGSKTDILLLRDRLLQIATDRIFVPTRARLIQAGKIPATPPAPSGPSGPGGPGGSGGRQPERPGVGGR